jgi:uncharacterized HAD superfamily protein
MSDEELERVMSEVAALRQSCPDVLTSADRRQRCLAIARIHKDLKRIALRSLRKFREDMQAGKPLDRQRVVSVLTNCEVELGAEYDSTIQLAKLAADEIEQREKAQ